MNIASPTRTRPPGSLRRVSKRAKGKTYERWQWRTHRRTDTGWATVDFEIGENLLCTRTRVYVALGELKAPLLLERWVRWRFHKWLAIPPWTGRPDAARHHQRVAWWIELPRTADGDVKLRFRDLGAGYDFRQARMVIKEAESVATSIWQYLANDPLVELARLLWQEQQAQKNVDDCNERLIELRRDRRAGRLNQRDFEADERQTYLTIDGFEEVASASCRRHDELLAELVAAMPRPHREAYRSRILATVDRIFNDPRQQRRWHADQWEDNVLTWRC